MLNKGDGMIHKNRPRLSDGQLKVVDKMKGNSDVKSYLLLGCLHIPHHNKKIFGGILDLMDTHKFDGIILGGDVLDMGALSSYEKNKINKTGITLEDEYFAGNLVLDELEKRLPKNAEKVFMFGNHEDRYYRWLSDVNNSKYGDLIDPIKALGLQNRGYNVYNNYKQDYHKLGSIYVSHGNFYNIHVAKKMLDTWRRNTICFHTHRVQMYREGNFCSYVGGFLGDIESDAFYYMPIAQKQKWGNALMIVNLIGKRHYIDLINCVDNGFTYAGVKYGQ